MDLLDKFVDVAVSGLNWAAKELVPDPIKKRLRDQLRRANPFRKLSTSHDLQRAARLAWIEAAEEILKQANKFADLSDQRGEGAEIHRFDAAIRPVLAQIRQKAFDRDAMPAPTAIDAILPTLIERVPESITPGAHQGLGRDVAQGFAETLATLSGWPLAALPGIYRHLAQDGLEVKGGGRRDFGELLFAAFAEILKSPNRYPEAREAFHLAMARMTQELGQATLVAIKGLDAKLDAAFAGADGGAILREGAARYLEMLTRIGEDVIATRANTEELLAGQDRIEAVLQQVLVRSGVPDETLRAILAAMGEAATTADPAEIEAKLRAKAEDYCALRDRLNRLTNDEPNVTKLRHAAAASLERGLFAEADAHLASAEALDLSDLKDLEAFARKKRLSAAETRAERAAAAKLRLNPDGYREAADHYAEAARIAHNADAAVARGYAIQQGNSLIDLGTEFGLNAALLEAIDHFQARTSRVDREANATEWAVSQIFLGNALYRLGEREAGSLRLEQAIEAYELALEDISRTRDPMDWATAQNNLGLALTSLGERQSGIVRLEQAVQAHRLALEERRVERVPLEWASTQNNLGNTLSSLGMRESGTLRLEQAVEAYRLALQEYTRERTPMNWAITQNNLGLALASLGERESGSVRLEQAVEAYSLALQERTRERVPLDWAMTQSNLGNALSALGERESGTFRLEQAVEAYRRALQERTRERVPLDWSTTLNNLGNALSMLGVREGGISRLQEAVEVYRLALQERTRERVPLYWAMTQSNLGNALSLLGERESSGTLWLEQAVTAYRLALEEYRREQVPLNWAGCFGSMGAAIVWIADRRNDCVLAREGLDRINEALTVLREAGHVPWERYIEDQSNKARAVVALLCGDHF